MAQVSRGPRASAAVSWRPLTATPLPTWAKTAYFASPTRGLGQFTFDRSFRQRRRDELIEQLLVDCDGRALDHGADLKIVCECGKRDVRAPDVRALTI